MTPNPHFRKGFSMNIQTIFSDQAPAAVGPYSQALCVNGFLFASG